MFVKRKHVPVSILSFLIASKTFGSMLASFPIVVSLLAVGVALCPALTMHRRFVLCDFFFSWQGGGQDTAIPKDEAGQR